MRAFVPHLAIFLVGLLILPSLVLFRYEIQWEPDSSIRLTPKPSSSLSRSHENPGFFETLMADDVTQKTCARNRWIIKKALRESGDKVLNFFALISRGFLKEIPNCPQGGTYELSQSDSDTVICTIHGQTDN